MNAEKQLDATRNRSIWWNLLLVTLPWIVFCIQENTPIYRAFLEILIGPGRELPHLFQNWVAMAPFMLILIIGLLVAWARKFPIWSYPWIGTAFFFGYREIFDIVIKVSPVIVPDKADLITHAFYFAVTPLTLAFLLAWITRKEWTFACFAAYPYCSIIMAWYTLDRTPSYILVLSLIIYDLFAFFFLAASRPISKFASLISGTAVVAGGFFLLICPLWTAVLLTGRNILIVSFPLILAGLRLWSRTRWSSIQVSGRSLEGGP